MPGRFLTALILALAEEFLKAGSITVSAELDENWDKQLARFRKQFIGQTPFFVVNRALGYRITHLRARRCGAD
jgi:hypothetical protein